MRDDNGPDDYDVIYAHRRHWLLSRTAWPHGTFPRTPMRIRWIAKNGTRFLVLATPHDPEYRFLGGYLPDGTFRFMSAPKRHHRRLRTAAGIEPPP